MSILSLNDLLHPIFFFCETPILKQIKPWPWLLRQRQVGNLHYWVYLPCLGATAALSCCLTLLCCVVHVINGSFTSKTPVFGWLGTALANYHQRHCHQWFYWQRNLQLCHHSNWSALSEKIVAWVTWLCIGATVALHCGLTLLHCIFPVIGSVSSTSRPYFLWVGVALASYSWWHCWQYLH